MDTKTINEKVLGSIASSEKTHADSPSDTECDEVSTPLFVSASDSASFYKRGRRFVYSSQTALRNSLLAGVGFLELGNAGDFAANVWNDVPVPVFAIVLMAIGATAALSVVYFAAKDAVLSWRNIRLLRNERKYLLSEYAHCSEEKSDTRIAIGCRLDVNFRETGSETVDRIGMDSLLGFGAVMVGVGTYMAIDAQNRRVFEASNLMSGFIGNAPGAIYGIYNAGWSIFIWLRAQRHGSAFDAHIPSGRTRNKLLNRRLSVLKVHAVVNGLTGFIAGGASLVTSKFWYGYVPLIPCIISSIWCNYCWRKRIGYERPFFMYPMKFGVNEIMKELESVFCTREIFEKENLIQSLVSHPDSITELMDFIIKNDLFENLCSMILKEKQLADYIVAAGCTKNIVVDSLSLVQADSEYVPRILELCRKCIQEHGHTRLLYRERYLIEILGCYLRRLDTSPQSCTTREGA